VREDWDLVERASRGDEEAMDALVARHRPEVLRIAGHLLGESETAEDVAQEVMVRLHASLPGLRGDSELGTWLYRVTLNLCRDRMRAAKRRAPHVPVASVLDAPALRSEPTQDDAVDDERTRAAVRAAVARLPTEQKEAVSLRYLAELPYAEIARVTGTPQGTVASRVFRALKRLGKELETMRFKEIS